MTPNKLLGHVEEAFISTAILFAGFVLFVNVVTRALGYSMKWAEEFTRYIIVWITFVGGSVCVREYAHVGIDAFVSTLSNRSQELMKFIVYLIGIVFSVVMTWLGFLLMRQAMRFGQLTAAMMIPMWIPYAGIPVGSLLMTLRYFQTASKALHLYRTGAGEDAADSASGSAAAAVHAAAGSKETSLKETSSKDAPPPNETPARKQEDRS